MQTIPNNHDAPTLCHIGIGANLDSDLGSPKDGVLWAMNMLSNHPHTWQFVASSLYQSKAYGVTDQPDFINAVAKFYTDLPAHALLDVLQNLENQAGRIRLVRWGARTLDLDLLTYGDKAIRTERLIVPHVEMLKRNFVLVPMREISPDMTLLGRRLDGYENANNFDNLWRLI